jgi:flagellar assembly factor FliW
MQSIRENIIVELLLERKKNIFFPKGLLMCDNIKDFCLIAKEGESPLLWLESIIYPHINFITLDPFLVLPEYEPEISNADFGLLNENNLENLLILCIVSLNKIYKTESMTMNLTNPILINWKTSIGIQVFLKNKSNFGTDFPISRNEFHHGNID